MRSKGNLLLLGVESDDRLAECKCFGFAKSEVKGNDHGPKCENWRTVKGVGFVLCHVAFLSRHSTAILPARRGFQGGVVHQIGEELL